MFRLICTALGFSGALVVLAFIPAQLKKPVPVPDVISRWIPATVDTVVVFTGYPGCSTVCPLALPAMAEAQHTSAQAGRNMGFLFINIIPGYDEQLLNVYTAAIANGVTAVQPAQHELLELTRALNLSHGPSPVFRNEYDHNGLMFVLAKTGAEWQLIRRIPASKQSRSQLFTALHL
jgi:cytochrome oxidase Cu insertion factor (SCO1/SenC/PrrC family)